ncbi:site-specific DNA-methyltransferase [Roseomonas aeriglobus]|nr:site-specific DNA-methyltransferase [Roseomonas aeriglobus]
MGTSDLPPSSLLSGAMTTLRIESPKRDASAKRGWSGFFPYYAGFPDRFASELIASATLDREAVVWDPWNGSGTTTYAASSLGLNAVGGDINAVMLIVARARLLPVSEADSLVPVASRVIEAAARSRVKARQDDPLALWFDAPTTARLRALDHAIRSHLVSSDTVRLAPSSLLQKMSGLAASLYVSLFHLCRSKLSELQSSNPTWYRRELAGNSRISITRDDLNRTFLALVTSMKDALVSVPTMQFQERGHVSLYMGDTANSHHTDRLFDFVLTSPPYCTRIDYAASTRIELAIVGPWLAIDVNDLSRAMIGTTKVPRDEPSPRKAWGSECIGFLKKVRDHTSKASRSYYYKNHLDYFDKMAKSMGSISSRLKKDAVAVLIVQDSYYKDVHNPLPLIITEMAAQVGLSQIDQKDFNSVRSMSGINSSSTIYREHKRPVESVIVFRKGD